MGLGKLDLNNYRETAEQFLKQVGFEPERFVESVRLMIDFYLEQGFSVIPIALVPEGHELEKASLIRWKHYQERQPTKEEIERWFEQFKYFNIAIVTGKVSNLTVIDIDEKNDKIIEKISTAIVETKKGYQIYFRTVDKSFVISNNPDIRVKGEGGYVLAPPSIHPSGFIYRFIIGKSLDVIKGKEEYEKAIQLIVRTYGKQKLIESNEKTSDSTIEVTCRGIKFTFKFDWSVEKFLESVELPPCIKKMMNKTEEERTHDENVVLRDFFMTIGLTKDQVFTLFKIINKEKFDPKITAQQIGYWFEKRYMPMNCDRLQENGFCVGCELKGKIKNPLTYFRFKNGSLTYPIPNKKKRTPIPDDIKPFIPKHIDSLRPDQYNIIKQLISHVEQNQDCVLNPPTGYGKTFIATVVAKFIGSTVIVEPDRGMQDQLAEKYDVIVVKGKRNYICPVNKKTADKAPCSILKNYKCDIDCDWKKTLMLAKDAIENEGVVSCNFGNIGWAFHPHARLVIIDEYHKVLEELSQPIRVKYFERDSLEEIVKLNLAEIEREIEELQTKAEELNPNSKDFEKIAEEIKGLKDKQRQLYLLLENIEYAYGFWRNGKFYIQLDVVGVAKWLDKRIQAPKIYISATPIMFKDIPVVTTNYKVATKTNAPIIYLPVTKLTANAVRRNPDLLKLSADLIELIYEYYRKITDKAVVHTANTKQHLQIPAQILEKRGYKVIKHTKGMLDEAIRQFKESDAHFLFVANADAGYDFDNDIGLQFILKVPYPDLSDPYWSAMAKKVGWEKVFEEIDRKAVNTIVQICGRICRDEEDVGVTIILDEKFEELFEKRKDWFPDDFKERLVGGWDF